MVRKLGIILIIGALSFGVLAQDPTATPEPTLEVTLEGSETAEGSPSPEETPSQEGSATVEETPSAEGSATAEGTLTPEGTVTAEGSLSPEETPPVEETATTPEPTLVPTLAPTEQPPTGSGVQPAAIVSIQQLIDDPNTYYGMPVALEGDIKDFINSRMFVLNEGAVVDSDELLVVNTSDTNFNPWVVTGRHYQLVGMVHPSYNEMGGLEALNAASTGQDVQTMAETTSRWSLNDLLALSIMDGVENHIIIEVMDAAQVVGFADLNEIASNDLRYAGFNFYVLGTVGAPVTANAFLLTEDALLDADRVLVVNADTSTLREGQRVKVWGQIGGFPYFRNIPDAGFNLNDAAFADYQDYTVLRAESIELLP